MKSQVLLQGDYIDENGSLVEQGYLLIANGQIEYVGRENPLTEEQEAETYKMPTGSIIMPGMIDVHIHGASGADVMDGTDEVLSIMAKALPAEGTTSFLATTMTENPLHIENALSQTAFFIEKQKPGSAEIVGIHLEGPFICPKRAGAQPKEFIETPNIKLFKQWQEKAQNQIRLVTLAPEMENGYELASYLSSNGIIASIGHSDSTFEEVKEGIRSGISHVTHLFNGMRGMHHRDPGVAGAALIQKELNVEMIVDGVHASPEMINLAYQSTGSNRTILITDSMRAKGLGAGSYTLGGQQVTVENGRAYLEDGTLAGSILSMKDAVKNMMDYTGCSIADIVKMTSVNAAKELNIYDKKGSLTKGKDADITVLTEDHEVFMTFCRGELAYQRKEEQV
ncbi:N-acetylglucosamine-6-phosphate deacetylase [Fictibacillus phosphorivorans]|uniref:N-acetylglucosamine-6-phosphate deacetylase n=1 Tax=Fictibacillus phosphorivorans TaxID=1221500 RepID=UPI00203B5694|nr:N-acetylglucosamine-6-phosphate deacetylase [Fictibacillus phosphorivorans]MCM3718700.1 N-acetylglucosamine-6-phosphate deacetylase [Fictibacillus phosphorivorans]MCM3776323.1 N-acetylglucosamine-6-phosphate deacetylase [Fictibacillus phosphorivorans]